jgi:LPS-assembly lipoprotein
MSWFDRVRCTFALAAALGVSGCFQPLYSESSHAGVAEAMKEVEVSPVTGRFGHYLTDDLLTQMNGTGEALPAKYRLQINIGKSANTPTVESQITFATSTTVTGIAYITLTEIATSKVVYTGQAVSIAPYDRNFNDYANLRAARDAELRLARSLADEISLRVAGAIASKS